MARWRAKIAADMDGSALWRDYAGKNEYLNPSDRGNRIQKAIVNDKGADVHGLFASALKRARDYAIEGATCYATVPFGSRLLPDLSKLSIAAASGSATCWCGSNSNS